MTTMTNAFENLVEDMSDSEKWSEVREKFVEIVEIVSKMRNGVLISKEDIEAYKVCNDYRIIEIFTKEYEEDFMKIMTTIFSFKNKNSHVLKLIEYIVKDDRHGAFQKMKGYEDDADLTPFEMSGCILSEINVAKEYVVLSAYRTLKEIKQRKRSV